MSVLVKYNINVLYSHKMTPNIIEKFRSSKHRDHCNKGNNRLVENIIAQKLQVFCIETSHM